VESVPTLEKVITDFGGQVKTHLNVAIFAAMPPAQIEKIAADPRVWNITLPDSAYPVVQDRFARI
jgi:hypothetical protein